MQGGCANMYCYVPSTEPAKITATTALVPCFAGGMQVVTFVCSVMLLFVVVIVVIVFCFVLFVAF